MKRLIVLVCLLLPACATNRINTRMASWNGQTVGKLLERWGPPSQILPDGPNQIYSYVYDRAYTVQQPSTVVNVGSRNRPQPMIFGGNANTYNYRAWRMFWVNPDGKIVRWAWGGR